MASRLANSRRYPGTAEAVGRAMVELADWRMLIHSHRQARILLAGRPGLEHETCIVLDPTPCIGRKPCTLQRYAPLADQLKTPGKRSYRQLKINARPRGKPVER